MYWSACLTLLLLSTCSAGLLRVPKVYNAIINSNDNLTPSRAFPLIQPVIQETALGYPLSPVVYVPEKQSAQQSDNARQSEPPTFEVKIPPPDDIKNESPKQDQPKNQQPKDNVPIKLNEFGIPPSLVPVQNYLPKVTYPYDPYANYNPYFTDPYTGLILPYSNPYNPYYPSPFAQNPFSPYSLLHPSFYGLQQTGPWSNPNWLPGRVPQQESAEPQLQPQPQPQLQPQPRPQLQPQPRPQLQPQPQPQPQLQPRPQPRPQPQPQQQTQPIKPDQIGYPPADLNVKNNANKNSNIPDVPPPPLPVGGLKYDNKKSSS